MFKPCLKPGFPMQKFRSTAKNFHISRNGLAEITDYSKIDDPNAALLDKQQQNKGSFFHELLRFKTHV